ncbi:polyprenyl synthetase family protein [Chitinispirillales bacterium ANBcel5]|uniref:polyprenyl synthetase family protein n=1 Tax=Cellulosispirillum alkaliphilum TaxID=3039283 RepID=UPI002A5482DD|nr:polyprenyl synthetase family protein [Chitinispirillales bacterium ANBcel5]
MDELKKYIKKACEATDFTLQRILPPEDMYPTSIHKLMRYSSFAGGKRVRPCLVIAAHEASGGSFGDENVLKAAAAIEMLHTFSLIHDDLPCMDDDDFRRGKPTAHKAFDEATAVLGGDALCILAFEVLATTGKIEIIQEIAKALGTRGMIGGQVVDIESEGKTVTKDIVEYIHNNKTAALIKASVRVGAILAGASNHTLEKLTSYGNSVGLAFQVVDDILDVESTTEQLGKDAGSDKERGKATFPAVWGLEQSKVYAKKLIEDAWNEIEFLGEKGIILRELAEYIRVRIS